MKTTTRLIVTLLIFNSLTIYAQNIVGFWEIKEVIVGGKTMTPVAKWTKINKDGSYESGNGWLQNAQGTWTYNKKRNLYSPAEKNGIKDEFGPFTVEYKDNTMTWLREEDGRIVTVSLEKIIKMPKATADHLVGLWDLTSVTKNDKDITAAFDPDNKCYLFIRWDRMFVKRNSEGNRITGYWHINGHKPEITFLSKTKNNESWRIEITATEFKMIGISDTNKDTEMTYQRIYEFPK